MPGRVWLLGRVWSDGLLTVAGCFFSDDDLLVCDDDERDDDVDVERDGDDVLCEDDDERDCDDDERDGDDDERDGDDERPEDWRAGVDFFTSEDLLVWASMSDMNAVRAKLISIAPIIFLIDPMI